MDILKIAGSLTHLEFSRVLREIEQLNNAGKLQEASQKFNIMVDEESDLFSAIGHVYYDIMIDPETGGYKEDIARTLNSTKIF